VLRVELDLVEDVRPTGDRAARSRLQTADDGPSVPSFILAVPLVVAVVLFVSSAAGYALGRASL